MSVNTSQKCERSKIETRWFPDKGSSGVFESWVAPKLGGRSGFYKMGDMIVIFMDLVSKGRLARLD